MAAAAGVLLIFMSVMVAGGEIIDHRRENCSKGRRNVRDGVCSSSDGLLA
jgi:hypothetical protein